MKSNEARCASLVQVLPEAKMMTGQCYLFSVSAFRLLLWFLLSLFPSSSVCLFFFFLLASVSSLFVVPVFGFFYYVFPASACVAAPRG